MTETQYQRLLDGLTQVSMRLDETQAQTNLRLDRMEETIRSSNAETRRHFDVMVEHLEHKIGLVAEGLMSVEERFTAEFAQVRAELRSEIRLAYTALDHRISALENDGRA
jgi:hypothetical protein